MPSTPRCPLKRYSAGSSTMPAARVQVNVGDGLLEVCLGVDHACTVSALPEAAEIAATAVELSRHLGLEPEHRAPQGGRGCPHHEVVVVAHEAAGENPPNVELDHFVMAGADADRGA